MWLTVDPWRLYKRGLAPQILVRAALVWCCLLVSVLALLAASASANSITIGQLQYLGPDTNPAFKVTLDVAGITAAPLGLTNLILTEHSKQESTGPISIPTTTLPLAVLFVGGPPPFRLPVCPCSSISIQLVFTNGSAPVVITLANGQPFTVSPTETFVLRAAQGRNLQPGASIPIVLTSVPEPSALILLSSGLGILVMTGRRRERCARK